MKATPEEIAAYEKLAKERGGQVVYFSRMDDPAHWEDVIGKMTEEEFLTEVLNLAKRNGWKRAHFRPGREKCKRCGGFGFIGAGRGPQCKYCGGTGDSWRTAVQADGKGFLDLVLVRERVVWAELKAENGKMTMEQLEWLAALQTAQQEVYSWRPSNWAEIEKVLR